MSVAHSAQTTMPADLPHVYVRLRNGARVLAELTPRPEGDLYAVWNGESAEFFRLEPQDDGWPKVIDVTDTVAPAVVARMAQARTLEAKAARERARFMRKEDVDHFERTHRANLVKPTKQTQARQRPCPIHELFRRDQISAEEVLASREIRRVWETICAGMFSKAVSVGGSSGGHSSGPHWRIAMAHALRYKPWADALSGVKHIPLTAEEIRSALPRVDAEMLAAAVDQSVRKAKPTPHKCPPKTLEIVIGAVVDGLTCNQLDADYHWRKGTASKALIAGLALYVEMAGGRVPAGMDDDDMRPLK